MAGALQTESHGLKEASPELCDGFGKFLVDLSSQLSHDSVKKLAIIFRFSPAMFDRVKGDSLEFVRVLEEEGIITPTDISAVIHALESIDQRGTATAVQESFERNQISGAGRPILFLTELQRKHSLFVKALKEEYSERYSGVKPLPFIHDTWYCVNDVFVESCIQVIDNTKTKEDPSRWSPISSRHAIFSEPSVGRRITIEGEPGFGKSTLLLQYAYDWCTSSKESPLKNIDIFILIRLKEVKDTLNIFEEIRMLLPDDLPLTSLDIKTIITRDHCKVVIALDGYDEYSGMKRRATDVNRITQGRILSDCLIVITTRPSCLPKLQSPKIRHFKLTGFDTRMQEEYIDKSITSNEVTSGAKELIMRKLQENVVFSDICQVPFFFGTFVHMSRSAAGTKELNSVTDYFTFMLACFFSHHENKETTNNRIPAHSNSKEDPKQRSIVAKLAFKGLFGSKQTLIWSQTDLLKCLGSACYNRYVQAGVLVEEERTTFKVIRGSHADNQIVATTYVRFFHKTFQEFYAAYHIAHLAENQMDEIVIDILSKLFLFDLQYLLLFACGLRPTAARVVQYFMSTRREVAWMPSVLCLMEQQEQHVDEIMATLCLYDVYLFGDGYKLLGRATIKLLHTASQRNIFISRICLVHCFESVDLKKESIRLSSGLQLPRLHTLQELNVLHFHCIDLRDRAKDILDYSARCVALKILRFPYYFGSFLSGLILLPQSFDDKDLLNRLYRKHCKVEWEYCLKGDVFTWRLNLLSGRWEDREGNEMTDEEYRLRVARYEEYRK